MILGERGEVAGSDILTSLFIFISFKINIYYYFINI